MKKLLTEQDAALLQEAGGEFLLEKQTKNGWNY